MSRDQEQAEHQATNTAAPVQAKRASPDEEASFRRQSLNELGVRPIQRKRGAPSARQQSLGEIRSMIQRRATGEATRSDEAQQTAQSGVAGAGQAMPHAEQIQASFGKHDISAVKAHVGGDAAEASGELGAQAYATGNDVAFAQQPDLHTAAHEAAHTVQQRSGKVSGGLGPENDGHEQHADKVADAVVAGESAESLLDEATGGQSTATASAGDQAVQRSPVQMKDKKGLADQERPIPKREIERNRRHEELKSSSREKSQNATFNAMGTTLGLFARTLDKASRDLSWRVALAKNASKGSADLEDSLRFYRRTIISLSDKARTMKLQLSDLSYVSQDHFLYVEDNAATVIDSWRELLRVIDDVEASIGTVDIRGLEDGLTDLFHDIVPNQIPLGKGRGSNSDTDDLVSQNISRHLEGALAAAHSFASGNLGHEDRVVSHLEEIARWMPKPGEFAFPAFKSRVDELARLLAEIADKSPYVKTKFEKALQPIRNLP